MKQFITTIFFFVGSLSVLLGQQSKAWDRTYGGSGYEELNALLRVQDGNLIFAGIVQNGKENDVSEESRDRPNLVLNKGDMWLVRTNSDGLKIWDHRFGGDSLDRCWKVLQNGQGFLVFGETTSTQGTGDKTAPYYGGRDVWILQINDLGQKIWDKSYGGSRDDVPFNAVPLPDGGYLISCHSNSPISGTKTSPNFDTTNQTKDVWLLRIDRDGNQVSDKTYGGVGEEDSPTALEPTLDGGFLVGSGTTSVPSGNKTAPFKGVKDGWLFKIDAAGNLMWDKSYGGSGEDVLFEIHASDNNNYVLACSSASDKSGDKSENGFGILDYWIIKIDAQGKKIWDRTYGGKGLDALTAAYTNTRGYTLVGGVSSSIPSGNKKDTLRGGNDYWVLYIDKAGNKIREYTYGGDDNDALTKIIPLPDRSYLIGGHSASNQGFEKTENNRGGVGTNDMWVVKIQCVYDTDLGNDTIVCRSKPVVLDATIEDCFSCSYEWSTGDTTATITVASDVSTRYDVNVTVGNACEVPDDILITIRPTPDSADFVIRSPKCRDGSDGIIALDSAKGGTPPYFLVNGLDTAKSVFIYNLPAATYSIEVVDQNHCSLRKAVTLPNPPDFSVTVTPSLELLLGDSFRLLAQINPNKSALDTFFWSDKNIKTLDTVLRPRESKSYGITVVDSFGCVRTDLTQITVKRVNQVFAPNIFTPNDDGRNDFFTLQAGNSVTKIEDFQIFTREGVRIFEEKLLFPNDNTQGWNGKFRSHAFCDAGVYVFFAKVTYLDGYVEEIRGDVTLVR